jgi:PAS domain S-box-containing protein
MKLLHLEDNDTDAELVAAVVCSEWPECRITRLCTAREFKAALLLENFDLILSDYTMPGYDGLSALDAVRTACPDTPFVFLSGTIGEERAIEALRHGATDYVLKDSPARLLAAVRGALRQAQRENARRSAEDSLRKSREQFQQIAETIEDFIVLLDERGHCFYANPAYRKLLGDGDESVGATIFERVHPEDAGPFRAFIRKASQPGALRDFEYRVIPHGGQVRHVEARISVPPNRSSDVVALLLAGRDVTERKESEEKLHEQASLLGKARDAICLIDLQFAITHWNASAERIYGWRTDEVLGRNFRDLFFTTHEGRFDTAFALTLAHGEWHGEFPMAGADGRSLVVESSWSLVNDAQGRPKSILCINADVTSRRQLELELQRAQRIEGLGMLAGGVAHDLNNILTPILMSVGLLRPLATRPDDRLILDTLEASATHGTELVQQILLFARGGEGQRTEVRVGELLDGLGPFLKTSLRTAIELSLVHEEEIWPVLADATQIKPVLMNLCVNARDAMPGGGRIQISAANVRVLPGAQRGFHGEIPSGRHVRLSVADTGSGIPPEVLEKIFDPFFSTKEIGKGTGLGLSTIAGIVKNHEGAIQVESGSGRGTTFHIYLPAMTQAPPQPPVAATGEAPNGQGQLVLVIDDDEGIRFVAEKILAGHGYEVCTAPDGRRGLDEFERRRDRIALVICDEMMPGMRGAAVLEQIHRMAPTARLISMSGLLEGSESAGTPVDSPVISLTKPLTSESLLRAVAQAMEGSKAVAVRG